MAAVVLIVVTSSGQAASGQLERAPTPELRAGPAPGQVTAVPGPYLDASSAERTATALAAEMGSGPTRIVIATLETIAEGARSAGQTPTEWVGSFVSPNRVVWLVWLPGPYRLFSCPQSPCPAWSNRLCYDVIDATTGTLVVTGTTGAS